MEVTCAVKRVSPGGLLAPRSQQELGDLPSALPHVLTCSWIRAPDAGGLPFGVLGPVSTGATH